MTGHSSDPFNSPEVRRVVDFLGELGPRWGLPAEACRLHGYLYLIARPATEDEIASALGTEVTALSEALAWLTEYRLIERSGPAWSTGSDPWELMLRALEERRSRELKPALELLRDCHRRASKGDHQDHGVKSQISKLITLVEDIAAIDAQARRLSPQALRHLVGLGGRAARFIDRAVGGGGGK